MELEERLINNEEINIINVKNDEIEGESGKEVETESGTEIRIDTSAPRSVLEQVKYFNSFYLENPEKFPKDKSSELHLQYSKPIDTDSQTTEESRSTDKILNGSTVKESDLYQDWEGNEEDIDKDCDQDQVKENKKEAMVIGLVPPAQKHHYMPNTPSRKQPPGSPTSSRRGISQIPTASPIRTLSGSDPVSGSVPLSDNGISSESTPLANDNSVGGSEPRSSNFVAVHVNFFESPTPNQTSYGESGKEDDEEEESSGMQKEADINVSSNNAQGLRAVDKTDLSKGSRQNQSGSRSTKSARSPSPGHSRASSLTSSPRRTGGSGKGSVTVPEPFSLATDRRAVIPQRAASTSSPVPRLKAGVVRASFDSPQVPPKPSPKPSTAPEPFNLESVKRHEEALGKLKAELKAKEMKEEERRNFKAQPIAQPSPPGPRKSIPPTEGVEFRFASDERAGKRKEFTQRMEQKESRKIQEKQEVLEKTRMEMEMQIKEYRKSISFKAVPMPSFYKKGTKTDSRKETEPVNVGLNRPRRVIPLTPSFPLKTVRKPENTEKILGKMERTEFKTAKPPPGERPLTSRPAARRRSSGDLEAIAKEVKSKEDKAGIQGPTWSSKGKGGDSGSKTRDVVGNPNRGDKTKEEKAKEDKAKEVKTQDTKGEKGTEGTKEVMEGGKGETEETIGVGGMIGRTEEAKGVTDETTSVSGEFSNGETVGRVGKGEETRERKKSERDGFEAKKGSSRKDVKERPGVKALKKP